jgi:hypothetical protein
MSVFGEDLAPEVGRRYGSPVQMMQLKHGIFDEASVCVITVETVREIGRLAKQSPDVRRLRPNVGSWMLEVVGRAMQRNATHTPCSCPRCSARWLLHSRVLTDESYPVC